MNHGTKTDRDVQIEEELARNLSQMKVILQGTTGISKASDWLVGVAVESR